jgi:hypothetical protein
VQLKAQLRPGPAAIHPNLAFAYDSVDAAARDRAQPPLEAVVETLADFFLTHLEMLYFGADFTGVWPRCRDFVVRHCFYNSLSSILSPWSAKRTRQSVAAVAVTRLVGLLKEAIAWAAKIAPAASNTELRISAVGAIG